MPKGVIFWVIMIIWAIFGFMRNHSPDVRFGWGGDLLEFILFALLGWAVFGFVVQ